MARGRSAPTRRLVSSSPRPSRWLLDRLVSTRV
jgi:hypothetical protein